LGRESGKRRRCSLNKRGPERDQGDDGEGDEKLSGCSPRSRKGKRGPERKNGEGGKTEWGKKKMAQSIGMARVLVKKKSKEPVGGRRPGKTQTGRSKKSRKAIGRRS